MRSSHFVGKSIILPKVPYDGWYTGLEKAIARLSRFPERHPIAEDESEWLGITLRQMIYGKKPATYRLLFSIEGDTVVLHYIRHSARGPIELEEDE